MKIPRLEEAELRRRAREFLSKHNPKGSIPVAIEKIVEFDYELNIVPAPGLIKVRGIRLENDGLWAKPPATGRRP